MNDKLAAALQALAEMLDTGGSHQGPGFACGEANIIAGVLVHAGYPEAAANWLGAHAKGDDEGDEHSHLVTVKHDETFPARYATEYVIDEDAARQYVAEKFPSATITVSLAIDNVYEEGGTIKATVTDAVIPAPPPTGRDSDQGSEAWHEWAYDNLFPFTGTGREKGNAAYFATITASSDPSLVGEEFEWGV
jgi:hypothetical protein